MTGPRPIVRSQDPAVLEFPFRELEGVITTADRFYVRNHFPTPEIDRAQWRLKVDGAVFQTLELTYDEILAMPSRNLISTMECAGNNRIFLSPPVDGVQWELGGVSTAEWTGVALADILKRAQLKPEAVEVILVGADSGEVEDEPKLSGPINYSRSLPLAKASDPDVLLAYRMNGRDLSAQHGFPLRAVVPGWYAMASVKWLTGVIVIDRQYDGYFQTTDYAYWDRTNGSPVRVPISKMLVKAEIARPANDESIAPGSEYLITGAAWAGEARVAKVEVSFDAGLNWNAAKLSGQSSPHQWCLWEYAWRTPSEAGSFTITARATDENGNTQPVEHDPDRGSYMINYCLPITVAVR